MSVCPAPSSSSLFDAPTIKPKREVMEQIEGVISQAFAPETSAIASKTRVNRFHIVRWLRFRGKKDDVLIGQQMASAGEREWESQANR